MLLRREKEERERAHNIVQFALSLITEDLMNNYRASEMQTKGYYSCMNSSFNDMVAPPKPPKDTLFTRYLLSAPPHVVDYSSPNKSRPSSITSTTITVTAAVAAAAAVAAPANHHCQLWRKMFW